ncbi:hypothetical protein N7507_005850 [Penicillium longicatenatum]|nr:hypothetical protein N7507_005850 [Penicillium longicatenatum]
MKFLTILSMAVFAAFAVAGPSQANTQGKGQVGKRQRLDGKGLMEMGYGKGGWDVERVDGMWKGYKCLTPLLKR